MDSIAITGDKFYPSINEAIYLAPKILSDVGVEPKDFFSADGSGAEWEDLFAYEPDGIPNVLMEISQVPKGIVNGIPYYKTKVLLPVLTDDYWLYASDIKFSDVTQDKVIALYDAPSNKAPWV